MIFKKVTIGIFLIATLALLGCSTVVQNKGSDNNGQGKESPQTSNPLPNSTKEPQKEMQETEDGIDPIEEIIKDMSLEEKIGQMVIAGLDGYTIDNRTKTIIENYHVGGLVLFRRNVKNSNQLLDLINSLKSTNLKNKIPLFVCVDEEGGRVSRMPDEFEKLPSNKIIGEVNIDNFSYEIGSVIAQQVKSLGFNLDFAPVLDINSNPENPVIGERSFSADEKVVTGLGIETMKGIRAGGIIPVIKHFPGHGDTSVDSHVGLPSVDNDIDRLKSFELVPFVEAINNQADAVMIAHILLNKIDLESPASLSKIIITDILREQLNFNGVVITDDMTMGAIARNYKISDAAIKSVNAGSDIVLVCHGYGNMVGVMVALKKAVVEGTIAEERVNESVYRILKLKNKYKLTDETINSINIEEINKKTNEILDRVF